MDLANGKQFDVDSGAGEEKVLGISLRKSASGGSAELGTATDPVRTDPTGTTAQPVTDGGGSLSVDDGGGSLTVDGTVGITGSVTVVDGGGSVSIDDNGGSLTVDGTVTANAGTGFPSVQTEDAAAAGGETGLMVLGVRNDGGAARTSANGDFGALALDDAGRVGISDLGGTVSVDDGGGSLTVDGTVAISGTVPVSDGGATLSVDDGGGSLTVDGTVAVSGTVPVTDNGGSLTVDGTVTANAGTGFPSVQTEDAAAAGGETGLMVLGVRNDAAASRTSADGDFGALALDAAGRVGIADLGGSLSVDDNGGSLTVDNAALSVTGGGVEAAALRVTIASDSTGVLSVDDNGATLSIDDGASSITVDAPVGTPVFARLSDGAAALIGQKAMAASLPVVIASDQPKLLVTGDTGHDAVDAGAPVKIGFKAAVSALPTAVANADRVDAAGDRYGRQLVGHVDPGLMGFKAATYTTAQTGTALWTPAAGKCIAITSFVVAAFGTQSFRFTLWFGTGVDTAYTEGTDKVVVDVNLIPSSSVAPGVALALPVPICSTTADHVLRVTTDAAGSVRVSVHGYEYTP
jgi:hypothetical protein